jgi:hypothetical protein
MSLGVDSGAGPVRSEGMQSARSHLNLELLTSPDPKKRLPEKSGNRLLLLIQAIVLRV